MMNANLRPLQLAVTEGQEEEAITSCKKKIKMNAAK